MLTMNTPGELRTAAESASQSSQETECAQPSPTAFVDGSATWSAYTMDTGALAESSKRGNRKLSTTSLVALTCGFGGYVTTESNSIA